jgi:Flp pilus assembly protein TadD
MRRAGFALLLGGLLLGAAAPPDPNLLNREGAVASASGDFARAVELFRQAFILEPSQAILRANLFHALNNYAIQCASREEVDRAIQACSEALTLSPDDVRVASNLAIFFHNQAITRLERDDFDEARDAVVDAQRVADQFQLNSLAPTLRSTHARIFLFEGRHHFLRNEVSAALERFARCIEINPDEALAYLDRSRIYYEQDFFQDALSDLELAAQILGGPPQVEALIKRLKAEASAKGQPVSEQDPFFLIEAQGVTPSQEQVLKRILKEQRLQVARNLTVNPKKPVLVSVRRGEKVLDPGQWISTPGKRIEAERIEIGGAGVEFSDPKFRDVLRFHYLASLALNIGNPTAPYWFAVGLGLALEEGAPRLSKEETEQLSSAGENFLLLGVENLTAERIPKIEDSKQIRLACLECKALVIQMVNTLRMNGLRQLMHSLSEGTSFERALLDVANLTVEDIERDWRTSLGIPKG